MGHVILVVQRISHQNLRRKKNTFHAGNVLKILALNVKRAEDVFTVGKPNRVKEAMLGLEGRRKEHEKTCSLKRG